MNTITCQQSEVRRRVTVGEECPVVILTVINTSDLMHHLKDEKALGVILESYKTRCINALMNYLLSFHASGYLFICERVREVGQGTGNSLHNRAILWIVLFFFSALPCFYTFWTGLSLREF